MAQQYPEVLTPASRAVWIREQQRFLCDTILPSLGTDESRDQRLCKVSRNKLAYLWQHKRSKAIRVILNNSEHPNSPPCSNDTAAIQAYYENKCKNQRLKDALPPPPWREDVLQLKPTFLPDTTTHFTYEEVETVLHSLPNNKASGMDRVTYETLKARQSCQILTTIFNVCLENKRLPDSWKGVLVHRIPRKDNIPEEPSTWRDISPSPPSVRFS